MDIDGNLRGHAITWVKSEWLYKDTMTQTARNERPCGHCGKCNTKEGHDGCLKTLPNVMNACCGHGVTGDAYIQYENGTIIEGNEAINKIKHLMGGTENEQ